VPVVLRAPCRRTQQHPLYVDTHAKLNLRAHPDPSVPLPPVSVDFSGGHHPSDYGIPLGTAAMRPSRRSPSSPAQHSTRADSSAGALSPPVCMHAQGHHRPPRLPFSEVVSVRNPGRVATGALPAPVPRPAPSPVQHSSPEHAASALSTSNQIPDSPMLGQCTVHQLAVSSAAPRAYRRGRHTMTQICTGWRAPARYPATREG
jgi:hypothetical protein